MAGIATAFRPHPPPPWGRHAGALARSCFAQWGEYHRRLVNGKVLPAAKMLSADAILKETTYHVPARNIVCRIKNSFAAAFLVKYFDEEGFACTSSVKLPEEVSESSTYSEGSVQRILVNSYERDPQAREECIRHYGTTCVLCHCDLVATYGELMQGFIHIHHVRPLSCVGRGYRVDPIQDLRPVCPNCHAVVHRRDPPYSLDEVRQFLKSHKGDAGRFVPGG